MVVFLGGQEHTCKTKPADSEDITIEKRKDHFQDSIATSLLLAGN